MCLSVGEVRDNLDTICHQLPFIPSPLFGLLEARFLIGPEFTS